MSDERVAASTAAPVPGPATGVPESDRPGGRVRLAWRPALVVGGLALVLYLPGASWATLHANRPEITRGWSVDDETPLGTLSELSGIRKHRPDRNLGYPLMHPLMLGGVYAPWLAYLMATGAMDAPADEYPHGLDDPVRSLKVLALLSHLLSVLLAAGVVVAARDAGAQLGGERAGAAAALFTALMFPMFYYARTGNVDMPVLFFTAVALAAYARILRGGFTRARAVALGAAVGFAVATKEPAVAAFIGMPLVLLPLHRRAAVGGPPGRFLRLPVLALVVSVAAFALGSGLLIDPERFFAHVEFARTRVADVAGGHIWFLEAYPRTLAGHRDLAGLMAGQLAASLTVPGLLLGLAGVAIAWRRSPRLTALAVPALTYLVILFWSTRTSQIRYLLPVSLVLAVFAGYTTHAGLASRRTAVRMGTGALALFALGVGFLRGVDLTHAMLRDSRHAAGAWIAANAPAAGVVHYFGPNQTLPVIPSALVLERANTYDGAMMAPRIGPEAVRGIEQRWRSDPPVLIVLVPDHTSPPGVPHSASVPPETFRGLEDGSLGFERAALFETPRLMPWLPRPTLDYPTVNPPVRIYRPTEGRRGAED